MQAPCVEGDLVLGELQTLGLGCAHKLKPVAFLHLAQLRLPNLKSLTIGGLRGGGNRFTGELSVLIKQVGHHLESLTLEDMVFLQLNSFICISILLMMFMLSLDYQRCASGCDR